MPKITFPLAQMWGMLVREHSLLPEKYKNPEIAFSFPMLKGRDQALSIGWFSYPIVFLGSKAIINKPLSIIIATWEHDAIQSIACHESPSEFELVSAEFPCEQALGLKPDIPTKNTIFSAYAPLIDLFPDQPAGPAGKTLLELLTSVINPVLLPYYHAMPGKFFNWLQG